MKRLIVIFNKEISAKTKTLIREFESDGEIVSVHIEPFLTNSLSKITEEFNNKDENIYLFEGYPLEILLLFWVNNVDLQKLTVLVRKGLYLKTFKAERKWIPKWEIFQFDEEERKKW